MSSKADLADLKRKSMRGGMVMMFAQGAGTVIQLISTVVLARLLSPDDYGMIAMVGAITAFAGLFRDLGLSAAAVQHGRLSQNQMSNLFWLNVGMGALLSMTLAAASPLVAWFYNKPELVSLTVLLSITFFISSLGTQHGALMIREMRFLPHAASGIIGALVSLGTSILLALQGYEYWSLAWGSIVGGVVTTFLLFAFSSFRPTRWTPRAGIRTMLQFGGNVTVFEVVNYFSRNLDKILIGKLSGGEALGLYNRAYSLLMFPVEKLRGPIGSVAFPALSRLQDNPEGFRSYYIGVIRLLAFFSMPVSSVLYFVSEPIVAIVLGPQWHEAASIFSILAIVSLIQPVASFRGTLLMSLGRSRRYLLQGIAVSLITSLGFVVGIYSGSKGVAMAYAVTTWLSFLPLSIYCYKDTPIKVSHLLEVISFPLFLSVFAGIMTSVLSRFFSESLGNVGFVVSFTLVFLLIYIPPFALSKKWRRSFNQFFNRSSNEKILSAG